MAVAMSDFAAEFDSVDFHKIGPRSREKITHLLEALFENIIARLPISVFIEVGAFEADFSRRMKARYPDSVVWAFEANPRVYDHFADKLAGSGVTYRHAAIGAQTGRAVIHIPEQIANSAMPFVNRMGSLNEVGLRDSRSVPVDVAMQRLDDAVAGSLEKGRHALWVDVEGAVDQVVAGADATLRRTDVVLCELETRPVWKGQLLASDIEAQLAGKGFRIVARDCQKAFQYNGLFLRDSLLETHPGLDALIGGYFDAATAEWRRIVEASRAG